MCTSSVGCGKACELIYQVAFFPSREFSSCAVPCASYPAGARRSWGPYLSWDIHLLRHLLCSGTSFWASVSVLRLALQLAFSGSCTVIRGMQKQSDESFGGGQAQPVQTDDVGVHVEPYNIGFGFLEPAADQPLSGCPSRDAHDVDGIGPQVNPWHYEPGASEASPSVLPSDGFDEVSLHSLTAHRSRIILLFLPRFMMHFCKKSFQQPLMRRTLNCLGKKGSSRKSLAIPCLMP